MNFFQGLSRPMRLAAVVLIGIAFVAVVIGTITAVTSGNNEQAAPSSSAAPAPGSTGPSGTSAPGSSPAAPTTTTTTPPESPTTATPPPATPGQPGTTTAPNGGVPADQAAAKWVPVRVYNNSTIHGLAAKASDDFRADGWNVVETSNYPYGVIPTTTAYYTPGTDEETAAKALAAAFGMKAEPRFDGIKNASPGVIVIVTNDYQGVHTKGS